MTQDISQNGDKGTEDAPSDLTDQQRKALDVARALARYGVPIFVAPADPTKPEGFALPSRWQSTEPGAPSLEAIDRWRPGDALCAVGGHALDFMDVDPRNGGQESEVVLRAGGWWPRTFGEQATPSGGRHYLISPLSIGKHQGKGELLGGLDLQGGRPDGTGRGFLFLAPTVRKSKTTGEPIAYRWEVEPDTEAASEWAGVDDSGQQLADLIRSAQRVSGDAPSSTLPTADPFPDDPFSAPGRVFTDEEARRFVGPKLAAFASMTDKDTHFNAALNDLACAYSHFVPAFVTEAAAVAQMMAACERNGSVAYQGAATCRRTIMSGLRQTSDPWKAERSDPSPAPGQTGADQDGGTPGHVGGTPADGPVAPQSRADRIRSLLYVRSALDDIPPPTPLIAGVLDKATIAVLAGKFGTYKSFVALSWAAAVSTGRPWFGREVPEAAPTLYVAAEGLSGISKRLRAWEAGNNDGDRIADDRLAVIGGAIRLTDREDVHTIIEVARAQGSQLITLDTLHRCAPGVNENDSGEMSLVIEAISYIRESTGATVLLCHHTGHSGTRARGSSAIEDDADASWVIRLSEDDSEDRSAANPRTMHHRKTKDGELSSEIGLELVSVGEDAYVREVTIGDGLTGAGSIWLGAREIALKMDELGLPAAVGKRRAGPALRDAGLRIRTAQLEEALRLRKSGKSYADAPEIVPMPVLTGSEE